MKRIFYLLVFNAFVYTSHAQQPFLNEWIDYSKTYYKFKVGSFGPDAVGNPIRKGLVRISQSSLAANGLGNVPAEQFQLWRDGQEVPIYIPVATGTLSSSDYIEFWGEIANGKTDTYLYRDSSLQLSDVTCLETDTSAYFLTVNPAGNNKRFINAVNDVSNVSIAAEKNFMYTVSRHFRGLVNNGFGIYLEQKLYLSSYDSGEGYAGRAIQNSSPLAWTFSNLRADTTGLPMTFMLNVVGNAPNDREVKVLLNNDSLTQFPMGYFQLQKLVMGNIAANRIKGDAAAITVQNLTSEPTDEMKAAKMELNYPHLFNFEGASSFEFYINSSAVGRYLKIANFNRGTAQAILYDFTNGKRYIANTSITDTLQFLLEPSADNYHLLLVRSDGSTAKTISLLQTRNFTDFSKPSNQGDYLIITNPLLYGTAPDNYIQQYADYRSSDTGGHYNVKIIDIHELEDQFARGIKMHPLSIKNFLRYARASFAEAPSYVFLIGKGMTYVAYSSAFRDVEANPLTSQLNLVPVFGYPGSDNLLSSEDYDPVPATPIGRLSAVSPSEVGVYLAKIKEYESAQRDTSLKNVSDKLWMKKILQLAGANDVSIETIIDTFQSKYSRIISDTLFGGLVKTFSKTTSTGSAYAQSVIDFTNEYNQGSALVEYLGHSSSTSIDFSLDNPANYSNYGKYPLFIVNGCLAGNIFDYDANRLNNRSTLSEKFVLEPKLGAIGYLSSSSYGVLNYLDLFTERFYKSISGAQYGKGFGHVIHDGIIDALAYTNTDFYGRMHAEQFTFHGDPAVKLNYFSLPDYALDSSEMVLKPAYLTVASDSFTVNLKMHNLGKAANDSVHFSISRKYPNGTSEVVFSSNLTAIHSIDSLSFTFPIVANRDKGTTIITATLDDGNLLSELDENNNSASVAVKISAADLLPVSPYNYSIITTNTVDLSASTAYAFDSLTQYVMELDTTALFNSPVKISMQQVSTGGLIEFKNVPVSLNNTVYYWRVSEDSADMHWNTFSFIYRNAGNTGFEQAHFYQHTESSFKGVMLDSATRRFNFTKALNNLFIVQSVFPTSGDEDAQFSVALNGTIVTWSACVGHSIMFNVFDPLTLKPILDSTRPYNAGPTNCKDTMSRYNFEYSTQSPATRKNAMDFMDYFVQNGYYVVVRKVYDLGDADWAPTVWAKDTATYGHNNSLYHRLKDQGTLIDSFTLPRTFIFVYKKNDSANYKTVSVLSKGIYDRISLSQNIAVDDTAGTVTSPKFGPGKAWNKVKWSGVSEHGTDNTQLDIIAIDKNGNDSVLYTIGKSQSEQDISSLDATIYPYVQLRMRTKDSINVMPYQLQDWSVEFTPVPEGAVAANLGYDIPAELDFDHAENTENDSLTGYIIFKNISNAAFAPLKVRITLYDESNYPTVFDLPRTHALAAGDTVHIPFNLNISAFPAGTYNFYIDVNPDDDQPEQYHYNNFLYKYVTIKRDVVLASHSFDLTAKAVNKTVQLQWTVANELNVAAYSIEFSTDGRVFKSIGQVAATSVTAPVKHYAFTHTNPVNGTNYYRIKMIDKDGSVHYSPIRQVPVNFNNIFVYPNPFKNQLNVLIQQNTNPVIVRLADVAGRQVMQQTISGSAALNINNIAAGMYILQVIDGTQVHSFKVFKQ